MIDYPEIRERLSWIRGKTRVADRHCHSAQIGNKSAENTLPFVQHALREIEWEIKMIRKAMESETVS